MRASIRDLRASSKQIVIELAHGNTVIMTYHGKDFAKIVPLNQKCEVVKEDPAFGMWKDNKKVKSVKQFIDEIRKPRE